MLQRQQHLLHPVLVRSAMFQKSLSFFLSIWLALSSSTSTTRALSMVAAGAPSVSSLVGLRNLGNTCYLNSQLQCAYHIPLVRSIVLHCDEDAIGDDLVDHESDNPAMTTKSATLSSPGLQALRAVFSEMAGAAKVPTTMHRSAVVSPVVLTRTLGIPVYEQQDAQEFWKLLLPALQTARLTDLYQGAFQDYIAAQDGSGRRRIREETFLDISLNVPGDVRGSSVLESLAEMFGTPELLRADEGNGWRPAKGEDKVDALKGSKLLAQGLPAILQLHLKRFTYDWHRDVMEKTNVPMRFDSQLDLTALCADNVNESSSNTTNQEKLIYDLQAIVIHAGQYGAGHYYAYVRPNLDSNEWYRINDDEVDPVTWNDVLMDAVGGKVVITGSHKTCDASSSESTPKKGLMGKLLGVFCNKGSGEGSYGFGGSTSNAYVLQYVKRSERNRLYKV